MATCDTDHSTQFIHSSARVWSVVLCACSHCDASDSSQSAQFTCLCDSQVKSYLAGNPAISLALNDNLAIGRREGGSSSQYGGGYGSDVVMLDDCNFHESVSLDRFDSERTLELKPPDGEFALMNYRYDIASFCVVFRHVLLLQVVC